VVGRRRAGTGFRPGAQSAVARKPSRRQAVAMLAALILVAAAVSVASFVVKPSRARSFHLFYGTTFLNDDSSPVAVDLASGRPTIRLRNAVNAVSTPGQPAVTGQLQMVPLSGATLMLDAASGTFNMLDSSGYVIKTSNGGIQLPSFPETTSTSRGVASGDSAYIVQSGTAHSAVYLVSQSTVGSAIGAESSPRASISLNTPAANLPGAATSANGALWLLTGSAPSLTLRTLTVPSASNAGATLHDSVRGTISGPVAAVESAATSTDGVSGSAVAVASQNAVDVYSGGAHHHVTLPTAIAGLDQLLPVTDLHDVFAFLAHGTAGWSLITADIAGSRADVHRLADLPTGERYALPAESDGHLYTIDTNAVGKLVRIALDGTTAPVAGAAQYPLLSGEALSLQDAQIIAEGSRVIVNSRANYEAEVIFTDGSHRPHVIDKRSALQVDTNGAASLLAGAPPASKPTTTAKPRPQPAQAINDKIDCRTATQTPHIPLVSLGETAAQSVQLNWTYTKLDPSDCYPSTYTVTTTVVSGNAPPPPPPLVVRGQRGVNVTGLFPDTLYQFVVRAYINKRSTPSAPLDVRTAVQGPAAPTGVRVTSDDAGNWQVSWNSCGGVQNGCVPSASWQIIPKFCDGAGGLQGPPPTHTIIGDPTQHSFTVVYPGADDLLGRGLSFDVEGVGTSGTIGAPGSDNGCTYSWTPPVTSAIHLAASTPPSTTVSGTSTTTVTATFDGDQTHDLGGAGGTLTYELVQGGAVVSKQGPTTATTVHLRGIRPGRSYQVEAIVTPPHHQEASATVGPVDVTPAVASWPKLTVTAAFTDQGSQSGYLTVDIRGLTSFQAHGENFDIVGDGTRSQSALICNNAVYPLRASDIDPGTPQTFTDIDRSQYYGSCRVQIVLAQNANDAPPLLYGAGTFSKPAGFGVSIDPATFVANPNSFDAHWVDSSDVNVSYTGNSGGEALTSNWAMILSDDGGNTVCGGAQPPNPDSVTITASDQCLQNLPAHPDWVVLINHRYLFGQAPQVTVQVSGSAPLTSLDSSQFTASFEGGLDSAGHAAVDVSTTQSNIGGYTWNYEVDVAGFGAACGTGTDAPPLTIEVSDSCVSQFGDNAFSVTITAHGNGGPQIFTIPVNGHPPAIPSSGPTS